MNFDVNVILYSLLAGGATLAGIFLMVFKENWARRNSIKLISLAAGLLMATAFLHIIPETTELIDGAFLWVLAGFIIFYFLEHLIVIHSCVEGDCESHPIGFISFLGIGFHSLIDGLAIAAGFSIDFTLGVATSLSVILHEFPEGTTIMSILIHEGIDKKKALARSVLIALATPLGALLGLIILPLISDKILGGVLALVAGSFIYIAASDLIPQAHKKVSFYNILFFAIGVLLIYAI